VSGEEKKMLLDALLEGGKEGGKMKYERGGKSSSYLIDYGGDEEHAEPGTSTGRKPVPRRLRQEEDHFIKAP